MGIGRLEMGRLGSGQSGKISNWKVKEKTQDGSGSSREKEEREGKGLVLLDTAFWPVGGIRNAAHPLKLGRLGHRVEFSD
jgi:hypothetical protein